MTARLQVVEGRNRGAEVALSGKAIFEVGSAANADLRLEEPDVAPTHVKVYIQGEELAAFDVSGAGFLHNGKRTLKTNLKVGDTVNVGRAQLRVAAEVEQHEAGPAPVAFVPAAAAAPSRAELQAVKGNDAGRTFDLRAKDMFIIGRGVATDITVWDIRVSRVHCRIDRDGAGFVVTDLNASNGTYVNGRKIETHRLQPGDEIKVGSTVLQYVQG